VGKRVIYGVLAALTLCLSESLLAHLENKIIELQNEHLKLIVEKGEHGFRERFFAKKGTSWVLMLESGNDLRAEPALSIGGGAIPIVFQTATVEKDANDEKIVLLDARFGDMDLRKSIMLRRGEPWANVAISLQIRGDVELNHLLSTYSFLPDGKLISDYRSLDFVFTPQLRPEPEHIIPDHTFRAPAFMMQKGSVFAALVPDVNTIDQASRTVMSIGDLQVKTSPTPFFSFGLANWIAEPYRLRNTHVYYTSPDSLATHLQDTTISYGFLLYLNAETQPRRGFQEIVRFQWDAVGERNFRKATGPQSEPFAAYIKKAWQEYLPQVALDAEYRGKPITLLRQGRLAWSNSLHKEADNDCWFNVWFNALRTAYGLHMYADQADDEILRHKAERVLNLALLAPQKNGIAPSIFYLDSSGGYWIADHAWGGISKGEYLPMFHNAWTNYWLLRWIDLMPERRTEILSFTRAFAQFLLAQQRPSGVIPSWYDPETLRPASQLRDENAETAGAALFLTEFYKRTNEKLFLKGAERCMEYVFENILPEHKWFDFETFFSCSRKPVGFFDSYTQQHPQNTLSMHQAAEACYELSKVTKNNLYREKGTEIIDYISLYQQIWSPSWLSRELFGGFGVQNTDGEWSDSRQGYFAVTMMNYYEMTGRKEYFERGVAALRAMFSLFESDESPRTAENYAHAGRDQLAGVTGLHWGTGSSVVSIHLIRERYGDAYVNVEEQWGVGIDGCRIPRVVVQGSSMIVELVDNLSVPRTIRLKFDKLSQSHYQLAVNGKAFIDISQEELKEGIDVEI